MSKEETQPQTERRMFLPNGRQIHQPQPIAAVEWQPGKPPGGTPVSKPTSNKPK